MCRWPDVNPHAIFSISTPCRARRRLQLSPRPWSHEIRCGTKWVDTGFNFTTSKGTPIDLRNFHWRFRRVETTSRSHRHS